MMTGNVLFPRIIIDNFPIPSDRDPLSLSDLASQTAMPAKKGPYNILCTVPFLPGKPVRIPLPVSTRKKIPHQISGPVNTGKSRIESPAPSAHGKKPSFLHHSRISSSLEALFKIFTPSSVTRHKSSILTPNSPGR